MSNPDATFGQATHSLVVLDQQELSADHYRTLHDGYLADLAQAVKYGTLPDREQFRGLIGLSPLEMIATVDFGLTLPKMIAEAAFDWTNSDITQKRFQVVGSGKKKYRFKIYEPKHHISSDDAVAMMVKDGFPAARHEAGLAFAKAFPNEQLKRPIALLGSSAGVIGLRCVVCLGGSGAGRDLGLGRWGVGWRDGWGFLGAQEVSGA